jgi:hypothetical protein
MDRLTRIGGVLLDQAKAHPEWKEGKDKVVVMMMDGERDGISYYGYDQDEEGEVVQDLFYYLYVIAKANGLNLQFVGAEGKGRG